jgi:hypothetical protein
MTVFASAGQVHTMDYNANEVGFVPAIAGHYIQNTGNDDLVFPALFKRSDFVELSLNQWLRQLRVQMTQQHLHLSPPRSPRSEYEEEYLASGRPADGMQLRACELTVAEHMRGDERTKNWAIGTAGTARSYAAQYSGWPCRCHPLSPRSPRRSSGGASLIKPAVQQNRITPDPYAARPLGAAQKIDQQFQSAVSEARLAHEEQLGQAPRRADIARTKMNRHSFRSIKGLDHL